MKTRPLLTRLLPEDRRLQVRRLTQVCTKEFSAIPRIHDHGIVTYHVAGRSALWMGTSYRLEEGDILLIPSGAAHQIVEAEGAECWGLALCTACYRSACEGLVGQIFSEVAQGACAVRRVAPQNRAWVQRIFERLAEEVEGSRPYQEEAIRTLVGMLFLEIARAKDAEPPESPAMLPLVADALLYLERHALQPISLADVAVVMKRSAAYLTTLIKQQTGWTIMEWLAHLRMNEARRLLLHSDEFVEIIAERVGYTNVSHFYHIFRRFHETSPAAWRRENRRGHRARLDERA